MKIKAILQDTGEIIRVIHSVTVYAKNIFWDPIRRKEYELVGEKDKMPILVEKDRYTIDDMDDSDFAD